MTEKRFRKGKSILTDFPTGAIIDEKTGERYYDGIKPSYISSNELVKILNELHEESEQLKQEYQKLKHRHSLLHDECVDIECERYSLKKDVESLEKENEQLKQLMALHFTKKKMRSWKND